LPVSAVKYQYTLVIGKVHAALRILNDLPVLGTGIVLFFFIINRFPLADIGL
jgi:hypothetical protein